MKSVQLVGQEVRLLDQRRLPGDVTFINCRDYREVARAISDMVVRGAPAIGLAAAFAMVLAAEQACAKASSQAQLLAFLDTAAAELRQTRPTAVNLNWALEEIMAVARSAGREEICVRVRARAEEMAAQDEAMNRRIGHYGQSLLPEYCRVLTHCNAGALATGGYGTALGIIRAARQAGKKIEVFVDETRPLLQGARLTAWELVQEGFATTLICDNMAACLMSAGKVDAVLVGADRIAANGDVANKIGTYGFALLAQAHNIPFFVAAPASTIDLQTRDGSDITIEQRHPREVTHIAGIQIAPEGVQVWNPAFDVTPNRLVTAIVTDRGVLEPPYGDSLAKEFCDQAMTYSTGVGICWT